MVDVNSFNLQQTFPMAATIDAFANKTYKEAQMRNQQQELLLKGLNQFESGVNSLANRRIAIAQALAQAKLYGPVVNGLRTAPQAQVSPIYDRAGNPVTASSVQNQIASTPNVGAALPPMGATTASATPSPKPVPGTLGGVDPNAHIDNVMQVAPPPVPQPAPVPAIDEQTLAQALYSGAPQNPAEMIANMLQSQKNASEREFQQGQLSIGREELGVKKQLADIDAAYKTNSLKIEAAKLAVEEKLKREEITAKTYTDLMTNLTALEQKQAELAKMLPSGVYGSISSLIGANPAAKVAKRLMDGVSAQVDVIGSKIGMPTPGNLTSGTDIKRSSVDDLMSIYRQGLSQGTKK